MERTAGGDSSVVKVTGGRDASAAIGLREKHSELPAGRVRVHDVSALNNEVLT